MVFELLKTLKLKLVWGESLSKLRVLLLATAMFTANAYGEYIPEKQCVSLSKPQLKSALKILRENQKSSDMFVVDSYCEYCQEDYPKAIVVDKFSGETTSKSTSRFLANSAGESKLLINGKAVDLAYIYVNGENLAQKVGCETFGVSKVLD